MEEQKVKEITADEHLMVFKNGHLRDFIAACVKLETIKQYDPNETAGVRQMPPLNGQMPILIDVKAKDAVKNAEKEVDTQSKFLIAIEKVGEQFKINNELWKTIK